MVSSSLLNSECAIKGPKNGRTHSSSANVCAHLIIRPWLERQMPRCARCCRHLAVPTRNAPARQPPRRATILMADDEVSAVVL
jgi:hypothetical protein